MKKILGLSLVAAIALTTQASAKVEIEGSAALTSNYIWRGISYSDQRMTAQMGVDVSNVANVEGLHVNFWGSGIQEGSEIDTIVGYGFKAGSVDLDVSVINYYYTRDYVTGTFAGASYAEAYINASFKNYGFTVYKEVGYGDSASYDGLTYQLDAEFGPVSAYVGARTSPSSDTTTYAALGATWDCLLLPSYQMNATLAYNSGFTTSQAFLGGEGLTFALTLSKGF